MTNSIDFIFAIIAASFVGLKIGPLAGVVTISVSLFVMYKSMALPTNHPSSPRWLSSIFGDAFSVGLGILTDQVLSAFFAIISAISLKYGESNVHVGEQFHNIGQHTDSVALTSLGQKNIELGQAKMTFAENIDAFLSVWGIPGYQVVLLSYVAARIVYFAYLLFSRSK